MLSCNGSQFTSLGFFLPLGELGLDTAVLPDEHVSLLKMALGLKGKIPVEQKPETILSIDMPFDHAWEKGLENWHLKVSFERDQSNFQTLRG